MTTKTPLRSILVASLLALLPVRVLAAGGVLEVWFLDVGQGDAALVSTPSGKTILVDAGPAAAGGKVARFLRSHINAPLDIAVASHAHEDHAGGMSAALRAVGVRRYLDVAPAAGKTSRLLATLDKTVAAAGATHEHVDERTAPIQFDDGTTITVLSPLHPRLAACTDPTNCNSIALLVRSGDQTILLAADIEGATEDELLRRHKGALRARVLKSGHHGSRTATTTAWLRTVKPAVVVISVGAGNSYHHPHPSTLHRLEAEGLHPYRTDQLGTVHVVLAGTTPTVRSGESE